MNPEKKTRLRVPNRNFLLSAAASALLLRFVILPPVLNFEHTAFVWDAMSRHRADCSYGMQPSNQGGYPYDAIVVPGAEPDSPEWKMRQEAAEIALSKGLAPEIIVLGQKDHGSINTSTNMAELAEIAEKRNLGKVVVETNQYHALRATLLACANGVAASSVPAEAFLLEQDLQEVLAINEMYSSSGMMVTKLKEAFETLLLLWDHKGEIPTFFKRTIARWSWQLTP